MATLSELFVKLGLDAGSFSGGITDAQGKLDSFGSAALKAGGVLSAAITAPLTILGANAVSAAMDLEALRNGLIAITGSAEEADRQLEGLREVAKLPGLGFEEAVQGAINLQAVGFSADGSAQILKVFGNALATVGRGREDLNEVIRQLGQLASRGQVTADNLKPLIERVPQLATVMKNLWGTIDTQALQKMGIDSQTFITMVIEELGKLPPVVGGLKNDMENMRDTWRFALGEIGDAIAPLVSTFVSVAVPAIQAVASAFGSLDPSMQTIIVVVAGLAAAIGPLLLLFGGMASGISAIAGASAILVPLLSAMWPVVAAIAAAWATWELAKWASGFGPVKAVIDFLIGGLEKIWSWILKIPGVSKVVDGIKGSVSDAEKAFGKLTKGTDDQKKSSDKLTSSLEDLFKDGMKPNIKATDDHTSELKKWKKATDDAAKAAGVHWAEMHKLKEATYQAKQQVELFERGLIRVGNETVDYIDEAYRLRDSISSIENAARDVKDMMPQMSSEIQRAIGLSTPQVNKLGEAMKTLGLDAIQAKADIAREMAAARDEVLGSNVATDFEKKTAIYKALQAQIEASKAAGETIPADQLAMLTKLEQDLNINLPTKVETPWKNTMQQVSTAITNAAQSMVGILIGTEEGSISDAFKKLGQGVLSSFIEPFMGYIDDLIEMGIKKLIGWLLSETGLSGAFKTLGGMFGGIFGGAGDAAGQIAGQAAGQTAGGAGGTAASGALQSTLGTVFSGVSAAAGIGTMIGTFRLEGTMNAVEENTRYGMLYTLALVDTVQRDVMGVLWQIRGDLWEQVHTRLEEIRDHLNRIEFFGLPDLLGLIRDSIVPPLNMMAAAGGPVVNVYVTLDGKQLTSTVATEIVETLRSGGQQL